MEGRASIFVRSAQQCKNMFGFDATWYKHEEEVIETTELVCF